ncbi:MAG: hypothetical protein K2G17_09105 [Duncaniella sp.]|nr:hypothetical protein [Duncaniella sp.]MDE6188267.1 hypothetical protein [Duncaniella sp.]
MNIKNLRHIFLSATLAMATGVAIQSCSDDSAVFDVPDYSLVGEPVTVAVSVKLPQMEAQSRANLSDYALNQVESLWIRVYSEKTGLPTSDWLKLTPGTNTNEPAANEVTLKTETGPSYIVGVANVNNLAVTKSNPGATPIALGELLDKADTWSDFLDIAVVAPSDYNSVNAPQTPLPMAGCYSNIIAGGAHPTNPADWGNGNFTSYFIPAQKGVVSLGNGAIHMRRLVSQINFVVKSGDTNNIDVTVNSFSVHNAPKYSWLYERNDADGRKANFGDMATEESAGTFYADIPQYASQYISKDDAGVSTFNFWQAENKHTAIKDITKYQERDIVANGLFTSLTGDTWTPNNMASYVRISCTVNYRNQVHVNGDGEIVTGNAGQDMFRTGYADYVVHLGYIQGNNKAMDFNCYRNTKYTYTVTVNGLDDIRVDAYDESIPYPGEEGIVSDLSNETIELDAHYHAFNIELTEADIAEGNGGDAGTGFGFLIAAYRGGVQYLFDETTDLTGYDENLYNWIELRPTTSQSRLAEYKPQFGSNKADDTFYLVDLNNKLKAGELESGWYTVFVNEYTYEDMYKGDNSSSYGDERNTGDEPSWLSYINQDPRRFYIKVTQKKSPDGLRIYARSKYGVAQRSIQSYYSDQVFTPVQGSIPAGTAIGSERFNETEGLNLRSPSRTYGTDGANGRYNIAQYLSQSNTNLTITNENENSRPSWSTFVRQTVPMEIPAVTGVRTQGGLDLPARTLAANNPVKLPALVTLTNQAATFSDPQASGDYFIAAYNACMSRNRDNNGNGRIDPEELRWYIPAMGKYLRLLLGANSLSEQLIDFEDIGNLPFVNRTGTEKNYRYSWSSTTTDYSNFIRNDYLSRYMYVTSDQNRVLWALEGTSTSTWNEANTWGGGQTNPWQVRCIRNLGSNMRTITQGEKVTMAYTYNASTRTVTFNYYDQASIRPSAFTGNGTGSGQLPINLIDSEDNTVYRAFEFNDSDLGPIRVNGSNPTLTTLQNYIYTNPCSSLNTTAKSGWRIPNQKELAIMRNLEIFTNKDRQWISCTVSNFNTDTGSGGSYTNGGNKFMFTYTDRGSMLTSDNMSSHGSTLFVRCVRDVQ